MHNLSNITIVLATLSFLNCTKTNSDENDTRNNIMPFSVGLNLGQTVDIETSDGHVLTVSLKRKAFENQNTPSQTEENYESVVSKKVKRQKIPVDQNTSRNIDEVNELNQNLITTLETKSTKEYFWMPALIITKDKDTKIWFEMIHIFKTICDNYSKFTSIGGMKEENQKHLKSLKTISDVDAYYSNFKNNFNFHKPFLQDMSVSIFQKILIYYFQIFVVKMEWVIKRYFLFIQIHDPMQKNVN